MACIDPNPLNCNDFDVPVCEPVDEDDCPTFPIWVCCIMYESVNEAWKKTGIPPHKLRWMASTPAHMGVYWA